jgi:hypothetical protein
MAELLIRGEGGTILYCGIVEELVGHKWIPRDNEYCYAHNQGQAMAAIKHAKRPGQVKRVVAVAPAIGMFQRGETVSVERAQAHREGRDAG